MRHQSKKISFGRKRDSRRALFKNLANSLVLYEKIETTLEKAKVLKPKVERMVTRAKQDTLANRRILMQRLPTQNSVRKLFEVLGPRYKDRSGGYLRITKIGLRKGDGAHMSLIEFV